MFKPNLSRRTTARTLSTLLALTLAGTVGLGANGAVAAVAETPQGVTAVSTSQADDTGNVLVNWDALVDSATVSNIHVTLTGQTPLDIPSDYAEGAAFSGVAPGDLTASVVFEDQGSSPTSDPVTVDVTVLHVASPDAVTDVHARANGTDVTVIWTPAQDEDQNPTGAEYTNYEVTLQGEPLATVDHGLGETLFTDIEPGTYSLKVDAVNANHKTSATGSITVTGATVPDAPVNVTAHDLANGTVGASWDAAADNGNPIEYYQVVLTFPHGDDGDGGIPTYDSGSAVDGSTFETGFAGLPFDQGKYVVTVRAVNASGDGPTASTPEQDMVASTVPDAPTGVEATSPAENTAVVSWTAPVDDGGQPVESYAIAFNDDVYTADADASDFTIDNLEPGTYTASVVAQNSNGDSESSETVPVTVEGETTPDTTGPGAPTHLRATHIKKGGATTIKWNAPAANDGPEVALYLIVVDGRVSVTDGTRTWLKVKGLRAGPANVLVYALNENGFSKRAKITLHVKKSVAQAPKETLRLGMKGPAVKRLQEALYMRHHSGVFGKSTRTAVKDWQRAYGKNRTGVVNDRMRYLLHV